MTRTILLQRRRQSRQVQVQLDENLTLEALRSYASRLFSIGRQQFELAYEDEDQDIIILSKDADVNEALHVYDTMEKAPVFQIKAPKIERGQDHKVMSERRQEAQFMRRLFKLNKRDFSKVASASKDIIQCNWKKERLNRLVRSFCDEIEAIHSEEQENLDKLHQNHAALSCANPSFIQNHVSTPVAGESPVVIQPPTPSIQASPLFDLIHTPEKETIETLEFEVVSKSTSGESGTEPRIEFSGAVGVVQPISIALINRGKPVHAPSVSVLIRRLFGLFGLVGTGDMSNSTGLGRIVLNATGVIETGQCLTATFAVKCPNISGTAISLFRLETPEGAILSNTFSVFLNVQPLADKVPDSQKPPFIQTNANPTEMTLSPIVNSAEQTIQASLEQSKNQESQLSQSMGYSIIDTVEVGDSHNEAESTPIFPQTADVLVSSDCEIRHVEKDESKIGMETQESIHDFTVTPAQPETLGEFRMPTDCLISEDEQIPPKQMAKSELNQHLAKLNSLGYEDEEHNRELLEQYMDYHLVLQHLLQESLGQWTVVDSDGDADDFYGDEE